MRRDTLRRARWPNVALALAVLTTLPTAVAWPLISPPGPTLPSDEPRALGEPSPLPPRADEPPAGADGQPGGGERRAGTEGRGGERRAGTERDGGARRAGTERDGGARRAGTERDGGARRAG